MTTSNAFHMLILPLIQCTAVIFAAFATIRLVHLASVRLLEAGTRPVPGGVVEEPAYAGGYRMVATRADMKDAARVGASR